MSRQDLVEETGLSSGTVTNVVNDLIRQGLVIEAGTEESDGGRPRVSSRLPATGARHRAEVGETRVRVEAFDLGLGKIAGAEHSVDGGTGTGAGRSAHRRRLEESLAIAMPTPQPCLASGSRIGDR